MLRAFNRYLEDYGHRGVGESDVMSPRFADRPELLLAVLRTQILAPTSATPADILQRQTVVRERALAEIRARFGWRFHRWAIFSWWYRRLCRFFALREANRHHLMYYSAAARSLLLRLGEWLVEQGRLSSQEDIFYLTIEARADLLAGGSRDWQGMIQARRAERDHYATISVPDTIQDWSEVVRGTDTSSVVASDGVFHGIPISAGTGDGTGSFRPINGGLEPSLPWRHSRGLGHRSRHGAIVWRGSGVGRRDGRDTVTRGHHCPRIRIAGSCECVRHYHQTERRRSNQSGCGARRDHRSGTNATRQCH